MCKCDTNFIFIMPSPRKRIGFLPSEEVHEIIEKLCLANEFSQSKVTGLLVEEALRSRGVLSESPGSYKKKDGLMIWKSKKKLEVLTLLIFSLKRCLSQKNHLTKINSNLLIKNS